MVHQYFLSTAQERIQVVIPQMKSTYNPPFNSTPFTVISHHQVKVRAKVTIPHLSHLAVTQASKLKKLTPRLPELYLLECRIQTADASSELDCMMRFGLFKKKNWHDGDEESDDETEEKRRSHEDSKVTGEVDGNDPDVSDKDRNTLPYQDEIEHAQSVQVQKLLIYLLIQI